MTIQWGTFDKDDPEGVHVVPIGQRHRTDGGWCWCMPKIEEYDRLLVVHQLKTHRWGASSALLKRGQKCCTRCGVVQNMGNADGFCKGPVNLSLRVDGK